MNYQAPKLEDAIIQASKSLGIRCIDLEYEVLQMPRAGFLGLFKREAVIEVKIAHKAEAKLEAKSEIKKEHKSEHKAEAKKEHKAEHKTEHKSKREQREGREQKEGREGREYKELKPSDIEKIKPEIDLGLELLFAKHFDFDFIRSDFKESILFIYMDGKSSAAFAPRKQQEALLSLLYRYPGNKYNIRVRLILGASARDEYAKHCSNSQ